MRRGEDTTSVVEAAARVRPRWPGWWAGSLAWNRPLLADRYLAGCFRRAVRDTVDRLLPKVHDVAPSGRRHKPC